MKPVAIVFALTLGLAACGGSTETQADPAPDASAPAENRSIPVAEVHHAICGCVLKDVRRCGNYVDIDGHYVVLEWPELGRMEYCELKTEGANVEITGEMQDGKFVAASYRRVD